MLYLSGFAASSVLMNFLMMSTFYSDVSPAGFHPHSDAFVDDFVDFVDAGLINGYLC